MKKVSLEKLFEKPLSGEWGIEDSGKGIATPVIRTANFLNSGKLNLDNIVYREIDKTKYDSKLLKFGDIIIEKSGGSPNQPVGRVVYFDIVEKEYFTNNFTSILRPKSDNNSKYVFYLMRHLYDTRKVLKFQNQTTGIINLKLSDYLKQTVVKLSSNINEQNKIVNILDKLDNKILLRQEQLKELSNVIKSRFYEMFGDLFENPYSFPIVHLSEIAEYYNGLTYKPEMVVEDGSGTIVLRSSNIQDSKLDFNDIVRVNIQAKEKNIVRKNDILMCSRNGSERLVGKTAIINTTEKMYFGAFMMLIRSKYFEFLQQYFQTEHFRSTVRQGATTTINQITVKMMDKVKIPLPPLALQNQFADFVAEVDKSQLACQKSLDELETLKKSLMQAYFG